MRALKNDQTFDLQWPYIVVTCQSPSQSSTEFDKILSIFDKLLNNIKQFRPF